MNDKTAYEEFYEDFKKLDQHISEENELWKTKLLELLNFYWKDPEMKGQILDALQSIKHTA